VTRIPLSRSKGQRSRSPGRFGWLFKLLHNLYGYGRHHNLRHRPERAAACRSWIIMAQGALGAAGVRRVWAGAGLQRAAYRGGAYCAASRTACYAPPLIGGVLSDAFVWRLSVWRLSDVCLSVAYIGPKSRTERPRKTKIGTEVAHVTRDTTFNVKRSKVEVTRPLYSPPCWLVRQLQRWAWESVGREKLLLRCRLLGRARRFGAHGGRRWAGAYRGGRLPTACYECRTSHRSICNSVRCCRSGGHVVFMQLN